MQLARGPGYLVHIDGIINVLLQKFARISDQIWNAYIYKFAYNVERLVSLFNINNNN